MAGIYIHVPFCSSRCIYCDFYSTIHNLDLQHAYINALCAEIRLRKAELSGEKIQTVYFGGGTPSLLELDNLKSVLDTLHECFNLQPNSEITLESNPDDVTLSKADGWRNLGFNRVSLGVQTFHNDILKVLRRRHTAETARQAVDLLRKSGFGNLTLDLIYGLPGQTFEIWQDDIQQILALSVQHLSAYALSYEPGTVLYKMRENGEITEASEEMIREMYLYLISQTQHAGYRHYEISNFALPGYESRHNSSYWEGVPYLGVGPGAHSYDGKSQRRANLPHLKNYVQQPGRPDFQVENLDSVQLFEEYLLTGLRTAKGISLSTIKSKFGMGLDLQVSKLAESHVREGNLLREGDCLRLSRKGILISDYIISDLMLAGDE